MTVAITPESIVNSYIIISIAKIDNIGFPPVTSGYANCVAAVKNSESVNPIIAPNAGNLNNLCCGTCSPKAPSGYGVPVRTSKEPSSKPAFFYPSIASAAGVAS